MSGHDEKLWQQLRATLATCDAFRSDEALQALFATPRLQPWAQRAPSAPSVAARVDATLSALWSRRHVGGEPAMLNLLYALRDTVHPEDALRGELEALAERARPLLEKAEGPPPFATEQPAARSGDVIEQNVTISGHGQAGNITLTGKIEEEEGD